MMVLADNSQVTNCVLSWRNRQLLCRQSSGRNLRRFSSTLHKMIQQYAVLTVFHLPGRMLCIQSRWHQRKWQHALDFVRHLSRRFRSWRVRTSHSNTRVGFKFSSRDGFSNHCQGLRRPFFLVCTKFDAKSLWYPPRNSTMTDIRDLKKSVFPLGCVKTVHTLALRICYYNLWSFNALLKSR